MLKQGHVVSSTGSNLSFNHEFLPLVVKLHPRASFVQLDGRVDMKGHPKSKLFWRRSALDNFEDLGITLSNDTHGHYKFIDGYALGNVRAPKAYLSHVSHIHPCLTILPRTCL